MRHVILTCKNHPDLRWSCKEIAFSEGRYNGMRSLGFIGTPDGRGMFSDGSGLQCTVTTPECDCPTSDLIFAPEDALVVRHV